VRRDIVAQERGGVVTTSIVEQPSVSARRTTRETIEYQVGTDWESGQDNDH
jgi:hypothetical protein